MVVRFVCQGIIKVELWLKLQNFDYAATRKTSSASWGKLNLNDTCMSYFNTLIQLDYD